MEWSPAGHGLQYRKHAKRKHGIRFDRYFRGRYTVTGKTVTVGFGWESEGWTQDKCLKELGSLKEAAKIGQGPSTLREKQIEDRKQRQAEKKRNITFADFFEKTYWPVAVSSKKPESYRKEREHFRQWINPEIGDLPFREITRLRIEKIKHAMQEKKRSWRSIEYVLATIRQVWNLAKENGLTPLESPTKKVKQKKTSNKRIRFLSRDEAELLLNALRGKSEQTYQISLLSLDCGLRFGEVANLTFSDIDLKRESLTLRDTKSGTNRTVFMTQRVKEMIESLEFGNNGDLVFKTSKGGKLDRISHSFFRTVEELGLNDGVIDPRQKVVFHSLRHTYASWLVESGVDLYTVQKLLGHSSLVMTERYSHLSPNKLKSAIKQMENHSEEKPISYGRNATGQSGLSR